MLKNMCRLPLAEPMSAMVVAGLLLQKAVPLARETGLVLLQTTPTLYVDTLYKCVREVFFSTRSMYWFLANVPKITAIQGVLECKHEHFWTISPGTFVGSLVVRVREDADEQRVIFSPCFWKTFHYCNTALFTSNCRFSRKCGAN